MAYPYLPLRIIEPYDRHDPRGSITIGDSQDNDVAEFLHSDHALVGQTYDQSLALAQAFVTAMNKGTND